MNTYQELANAVVLQAAKDYRRALRRLKKIPGHGPSLQTVSDCERFFLSQWYCALTEVDGEGLMRMLRKEAEE